MRQVNAIRPVTRCIRCRMHTDHCICAAIPALQLQTRIVVVQHHREAHKTTETAHLITASCEGARILVRGERHRRLDTSFLEHVGRRAIVLFPRDDAVTLDDAFVAADPRPITLVVPDGTWRQAARAVKREPTLAALPCGKLPDGPPSRYLLREGPRADSLCTLEAVARAIGVIEGQEPQRSLEAMLDAMVAGSLAMRGQLQRLDAAVTRPR